MRARSVFPATAAAAALALIVSALPTGAPPAAAISSVESTSVGDGPTSLVLNRQGTYAFTANLLADTVTAIRLSDRTTTTIAVNDQPTDLRMRPGTDELWVTNYGTGTISIINTVTLQQTEFFSTVGAPADIAFLPDGSRAFVTLPLDDTVTVFNAATREPIRSWSVGDEPSGIAYDAERNRLLVTATANTAGGNRLNFINLSTNAVTSLTLTNGPSDVIVDAARDRAYVSMFFTGFVAAVNLNTDALIGYLNIAPQPQGLSMSFDNRLLLVAFSTRVQTIALDTWTAAASWTTNSGTSDVVMAPDGRTVYSTSFSVDALQRARLEVDRFAGSNRYETAIEMSQAAYTGTHHTVYLASGTSFPDALSLAPAVGVRPGPLLLNPASSLRSDVLAEIQRLDPTVVFIAGGPGVISTTVAQQVQATGATVVRLSGANRYATSLAVIQEFFEPGDPLDTLYLVTGRDFPDALSAGAAAAAREEPMILVDGRASSLPAAVTTRISQLDPDRVVLVGGTSVMSQGIQNQLNAIGGREIVRAAGADRYATSAAVTAVGFATYTSPATYWATGANFPDALAGITLAAGKKSPISLVRPSCLPSEVLSNAWRFGADRVGILGGTGVVSTAVENLVRC